MYLTFDTETTGKPKNYKGKMSDLDNWPRVIQLGWQVRDKDGNVLKETDYLIKPDGWEIPSIENLVAKGLSEAEATKESEFWRKHGYTTEKNEEAGVPMPEVLDDFLSDYNRCMYLIAHNIVFDHNVLGSEMLRYGKRGARKLDRICTMEAGTNLCKIPSPYGRGSYKWPKLEELHRKLFNEEFDGAHDALSDVRACSRCLFELMKRGVIITGHGK